MASSLRLNLSSNAIPLNFRSFPKQGFYRGTFLWSVRLNSRYLEGAAELTGLLQDLRYGVRSLWKSPGFTIVSLLTLALGIGANTAIFSFVNGVLLRPLPYADADSIIRVMEKPPQGERNGISTLNFLDWRNQNTVFEHMAAVRGDDVTLTGTGEPVQLRMAMVSPPYFDIFGTHAVLGRTFTADEDQRGKDHVVVLSHAIWETQFGADPKLVGGTIRLDGEPYTVIGVLPEGTSFDRSFWQLWTPLVFKPENMTRNFHWFISFAKLKPGVALEAARRQMDGIGARIAHDFPDSNKAGAWWWNLFPRSSLAPI